jgi:hypothetical protein
MKRLLCIVAVVVAALGTGAVARASQGAATPFKATYNGTPGATYTCAGAHVVNRVSVKDSERCVISGDTTGYVAGTYSGSPFGFLPWYGISDWISDYDGAIASSWMITVTENGDGTFTLDIVAYYS